MNFFLSAFKLHAKQISKEFLHGTAGTLNSLMKSSETFIYFFDLLVMIIFNVSMTIIQILAEITWVVSGVAKEATVILTKTYERTIEDGWSGANKWASEGIIGIVTNSVGIKIFFMKKRQKE